MIDFANLPLLIVIGIFIVAAIVIAVAGWRLAAQAARLADITGMGEAVAGALLLGATTSLPGILTSTVTAWNGFAELAVSNALGGILAQTVFLAIADITYRKINLEHAAASVSNILQTTLLMVLLCTPLIAATLPDLSFWGINPISLCLPVIYIACLKMIASSESHPTWVPSHTPETREDVPDEDAKNTNVSKLWISFVLTAAIVGGAGYFVAECGMVISEKTGLSESAVGGVLTALATSFPELVTVLAAVRQGALTLAVGDIIGGNCFDVLFIAAADFAYRDGSIYHVIGNQQLFLISIALLMTATLGMGLLRRQKKGIGNIGFESISILLLYCGAAVYLFLV